MVKNSTQVAEFTLRSEKALLQSPCNPTQPLPPEVTFPSDPAPWAGVFWGPFLVFCWFFC